MSEQPSRSSAISPAVVAFVAWIFPGGGYLLLKEFSRGITVAATIFFLFIAGLLIGGVRCIEVPGYNPHGVARYAYQTRVPDSNGHEVLITRYSDGLPTDHPEALDVGWALVKHPVDELRAKPWNVPQIMFGPLDILCDYWSVKLAQPANPANPTSPPIGILSHSRVNELGVLYTAIAGLLNLLAIIDSSHRAHRTEGK